MAYNSEEKPDPAVCPRRFCFCWRIGRVITAHTPEPPTVAEGCGSPFGMCTRLDPVNGDHDWYMTHDPNLEEAGLPWYTFIASPCQLVPALQAKYIEETEAVWGKAHWSTPESG